MILISHDVSESDHVTTTDPEPNQGPYDDIPQCISKTMTKFSTARGYYQWNEHKANKAIPAAKNGHPHRRLEHGYRRSVRVRHSTPHRNRPSNDMPLSRLKNA
ncbi:uncharacterized protein EAF02_008699 [Botrytis sinoallii]|uniref:uncharacterized protein n=1 Tax=Botrytis sinoallii TaxID=1463999 RepID=UPI001902B6C9|nr:uncharacterized protein EAF02_008699 [Botrytis sinoallii]KAF7874722.1 hypothetical protein EAF02_008699 [Botrytis sinoallii]